MRSRRWTRLWLIPMWGAYGIALAATVTRNMVIVIAGWIIGTVSAMAAKT